MTPANQHRSTIVLEDLAGTCGKLSRRIHTAFPGRSIDDHAKCFTERVDAIVKDGGRAIKAPRWLQRISAVAPRRGLVVAISDFLADPSTWKNPLGSLAIRHSVLCVQVVDPRDLDLPATGMLQFQDPADGSIREVNTDDKRVREQYAAAAGEQQAQIASQIRAAGADHLVLRTDGDWLMDLAQYVSRRRHRAEMTAGRRTR